jgi:hypothetical protein
MKNPIRTTVVFAFISGFVVVPTALLMSPYFSWAAAFKLTLWVDIALYGVLLARWGGTHLLSVFFPLAVLLGAALWPQIYNGFFILALGVFSWIRSGICFQKESTRTMLAEVTTMVGGAAMLLFFRSHNPAVIALNICLFFLVQALYFFWAPIQQNDQEAAASPDAFEQAVAHANKILDGM